MLDPTCTSCGKPEPPYVRAFAGTKAEEGIVVKNYSGAYLCERCCKALTPQEAGELLINQEAAERAFAKRMGWDDWTPDEESEGRVVRGFHIQWRPDPIGLVVPADSDDDAMWVLASGRAPEITFHGWLTAGEAKRQGRLIGEG